MSFTINSTIKAKPPAHPYEKMKEMILGKSYTLTLIFVGAKRAATLNEQYRNKTYIPNVLSFPLDDSNGEIYICPEVAKKEASKFNLSQNGYIAFLYIHGLLHLKGHDHSDTMDSLERKYLKVFKIA